MGARVRLGRGSGTAARLAGTTALAGMLMLAGPLFATSPALAQTDGPAASNGQMLLEADRLVHDRDNDTVTAEGSVRIDYDGRRLVAQRVVYDQASARMMAYGNVEMIDRDGTRTFAQEADVTDDFRDGFVNALRVETTDATYFASESAERAEGEVTTFHTGVYTACEPCEERPDKPPIWRVKSRTIIWNSREKTIRFIHPRLELFGLPIAYFPALTVPDHTVKRKSGFLSPELSFNSEKGFGLGVPYHLVFSPSADLTGTLTHYARQGFMGEAEFRQRFNSGQYSVTLAGISQNDPAAFAGPVDRSVSGRAMIGTRGHFRINPRWAFGWDAMAQTDKNFAFTYQIDGYHDYYRRDEIYLTGLNDRNYFDLRAMRFQIQENVLTGSNEVQPWVLPSFDYAYMPAQPLLGGELRIDVNAQALRRNRLSDPFAARANIALPPVDRNLPGLEGSSGRLTAEAEWKRSLIVPGGLVLTPSLHARGDGIWADLANTSRNAIAAATVGGVPVPNDLQSSYWRGMATAGLEARWPILFQSARTSHVIEPVAQIFARPDEPFAGTLGIPNEDAQSMVFDATSLFRRDKFSGYDRMEGGVRANLGFRYSGSLGSRWGVNGIFGQSFHLAGTNSFAAPDLVNAGAFSGLERDVSDYVGQVSLSGPRGLTLSAGGRFDQATFEAKRVNVGASANVGPATLSTNYSFIQAQPLYGFEADRHEVTLSATARVAEHWRVFGSGTYDFQSQKLLRNSIGFAYDDECFTFSFAMSQYRDTLPNSTAVTNSVGVRISLRTIGDFGSDSTTLGL